MEFLLLDIADLFFQSSYRISCLTVKNHVVEKTGLSKVKQTMILAFKLKFKYCEKASGSGRLIHTFVAF